MAAARDQAAARVLRSDADEAEQPAREAAAAGLAEQRRPADEAKRKPYIWEMQKILHEDGGAIIPVFRDWLSADNGKVGGHVPTGGFDMDNGYILEKAWLKA